MNEYVAFAFEDCAARGLNYLQRLVDPDGRPYFNVFWTEPAEAAHDWPDFGDVTARQFQGAVMLRRQREHMMRDTQPSQTELYLDEGMLDFWKIG
jgi:hypothetical protein